MKLGFIKCISPVLLVSLSLLSIGQSTAQKTQKPPNIILLLVGGIGWYRKKFTMPETLKGHDLFIDFDGVYQKSDV